jgi:hypothetical protein
MSAPQTSHCALIFKHIFVFQKPKQESPFASLASLKKTSFLSFTAAAQAAFLFSSGHHEPKEKTIRVYP